ncbi:MAG: DUF4184 family protein [Flavisolibacter sp.]|nr:DUF4184 family protein [Flavisolibacter sp.]
MPFTFSHPWIVLPLNRLKNNWFSLTGLVIGSITPDFEKFIKMKAEREFGHTISGLFWFNLPLAILLAFLFHNIIKQSLIENLPKALKGRFIPFNDFDWNKFFKRRWFAICVSILIGAISHLFLDSFTNGNGFFHHIFPVLDRYILFSFSRYPVIVSSLLSYVLSVIGSFIILYAIWQLPVQGNVRVSHSILPYWATIVQMTLFIALVRVKWTATIEMKQYWYLFFPTYIIFFVSAFLISLILISLLFRFTKQYQSRKLVFKNYAKG